MNWPANRSTSGRLRTPSWPSLPTAGPRACPARKCVRRALTPLGRIGLAQLLPSCRTESGMPFPSTDPETVEDRVVFRSPDGLHLRGTLARSEGPIVGAAVLVHGGGVTRDEGGFFTR